jgi:hypothetical protein
MSNYQVLSNGINRKFAFSDCHDKFRHKAQFLTPFIKKTTIILKMIRERRVDEHTAMPTINSDSCYVERTYTARIQACGYCQYVPNFFFPCSVLHTPL